MLPRGARTKLLFQASDIAMDVQVELRGCLTSTFAPGAPGTDAIDEELRTLPHVVREPWDAVRGERFNMLVPRNRERHLVQRQRVRFNWDAFDCSTFSKAREIPRPGLRALKLRSTAEPEGLASLSHEQRMTLEPHTLMAKTSFKACTKDA